MPSNNDYRLFLKEKFENVDEHFETVIDRLDKIDAHLTKLNGTVADHDKYIVYANGVIDARRKEMDDIQHRLEKTEECMANIDENMLEVKFFKRYPKVALGVIIVSIFIVIAGFITAFVSFGNLKKDVDTVKNDTRAIYYKMPNTSRGSSYDPLKTDSLRNTSQNN